MANALTKARVREFIRRVKNKAVAAINNKHSAIFDETVSTYLFEQRPDLGKALAQSQLLAEEINRFIIPIRSELMNEAIWRKKTSWAAKPEPVSNINYRQTVFSSFVPVGTAVDEVYTAWTEELTTVEKSYDALLSYLFHNSAGKTYKYLIKLGFDVSWIKELPPEKPQEEPTNIDPKNLFVCGETGAN